MSNTVWTPEEGWHDGPEVDNADLVRSLTQDVRKRLEYLRGEIRAECISFGELAELQLLAAHIDPGDVELLEWAGVPEGEETMRG
jgi:hypothetical protein